MSKFSKYSIQLDGPQRRLRAIPLLMFVLSGILSWTNVDAHVLQNMSWFETSREVEVTARELRIIHTCKFLPGRLSQADPLLDKDSDTTISQHELADFCNETARYLAQDVALIADNVPCPMRQESFLVLNDDSGFRSEMVAELPASTTTLTLLLNDPAFLLPVSVTGATNVSMVQSRDPAISFLDAQQVRHQTLRIPPSPISTLMLTRQSAASSSGTSQPMQLTNP